MSEVAWVGAHQVQDRAAESSLERESPDWIAARGFFIAATAAVVIDVLWLHRERETPNSFVILVLCGSILGLGLLPLGRQYERGKVAVSMPDAATWSMTAVFFAFLAFYSITSSMMATSFNEATLQAYAFLHGRTWVDLPGQFMEHVTWKGRTYLVHPPMAAIILMPIVAIQGLAANQTAVDMILGAFEVLLAWRLLGLLQLDLVPRVWLTLFFGIGTTLWYEATIGNSWDFVLVSSVLMTLLALNELFGQARPWVMGFLTAFAGLARYDLLPLCPIYAVMLMVRGRKLKELIPLIPGWLFGALIYVGFSELRYGSILDQSLFIYYPTDPYRAPHQHGPFSIAYLPQNLYTLFLQPPEFNNVFPYIHPIGVGQSLTVTSPALILVVNANFRRPMTILIAACAVIGAIPSLTCYASGFVQFGARYYVQVFPFVLVLMAFAAKRNFDQLARVLIVISMASVAFGVWHIRTWGYG